MEKIEILKRLRKTINKLEQLQDSKFNYGTYIKEVEENKDGTICGTVCCVAGWYPKWFPKSALSWSFAAVKNEVANRDLKSADGDVDVSLQKYHGVSLKVIQALFYGSGDNFEISAENLLSIQKIADKYDVVRIIGPYPEFTLGLKRDLGSDKYEVVKFFKFIIELIKKDLIDYKRTDD